MATLIPDLMFGSRVQSALTGAGHEVQMVPSPAAARDRSWSGTDVLVVDLTAGTEGADLVEALRGTGALAGTRTLAFYAHVEVDVRRRAEQAGFDLVVPRSRMAREGAELVSRLAGGSSAGSDLG